MVTTSTTDANLFALDRYRNGATSPHLAELPTCSIDRQLLHIGTTRSLVEDYRRTLDLCPLQQLTLPQQESVMQWLLTHADIVNNHV